MAERRSGVQDAQLAGDGDKLVDPTDAGDHWTEAPWVTPLAARKGYRSRRLGV